MVNEMIRLTPASIVLSSLWAVAPLPTLAQAMSDFDQATPVWSSRDGLLRLERMSASDPEVETLDEPSSRMAETEQSQSQSELVCEPFK